MLYNYLAPIENTLYQSIKQVPDLNTAVQNKLLPNNVHRKIYFIKILKLLFCHQPTTQSGDVVIKEIHINIFLQNIMYAT